MPPVDHPDVDELHLPEDDELVDDFVPATPIH